MAAPRSLLCVAFALGLLIAAASSRAEIYQYTDSQGRLHFTQDIGQVPPAYRHQVEKKVLKKDISVTGGGGDATRKERVRAMENRRRQLDVAARKNRRRSVRPLPAAPRKHPLTGVPEPRKYDRDYSRHYRAGHRRKTLTPARRAWNAANGGNNGKPDIRRRPGKR